MARVEAARRHQWPRQNLQEPNTILVGSPVGGWLGDKFGCKPLFMIDMGIFLVGSVLQFFVHEPWQLFVVRLLMGTLSAKVAIAKGYGLSEGLAGGVGLRGPWRITGRRSPC
ncbi:MFS transporter [Arthrobacter sp. SAFR-014]|uniref:MFS transporter n=1 Tax=unclassified Arthrobacter TaxID=235627 RepID=UPI003F7BB0EA